MIRVLLADDHAVVREGLKRILHEGPDIAVVAEAGTGPEVLALAVTRPCDVVVLDLALPGMSGLEVLETLTKQHPRLRVLVLSMHPEQPYAVRAIMAGAAGYLNKARPPGELVEAIRTVASGQRYLTAPVAESLAAYVHSASDKAPHEVLSNREYEVLRLLGSGRSVGDIARELSLSVKTVSTFRGRILSKLGLRNNAQLIRYALEHGLLE